jgi:hypothetical protein
MRIRDGDSSDPGWEKVGSRIRDKHPGSATLEFRSRRKFFSLQGKVVPDGIKVVARSPLKRELVESPALRDQITDFPGYMLGLPEKRAAESHPLRNPFDISRSALLDQVG